MESRRKTCFCVLFIICLVLCDQGSSMAGLVTRIQEDTGAFSMSQVSDFLGTDLASSNDISDSWRCDHRSPFDVHSDPLAAAYLSQTLGVDLSLAYQSTSLLKPDSLGATPTAEVQSFLGVITNRLFFRTQ